jgi:menaquinone-9 beta-reductase
MSLKPIRIVGGGLAGLTLGIGLRQRGVPATIYESGHYPRHRVCGEFINGNGLGVLARLGLCALLEQAGALPARNARFTVGQNHSPVRPLPSPALCLSRYSMDAALVREFQQLGGDLHENTRWTSELAEGVIRASGRRPQSREAGWRWVGMKVHARHVSLAADLEMHLGSTGYIGLNRIAPGEVNVCGLFRVSQGGLLKPRFESLRGDSGSALHQCLADADFDEDSFCAVAGLSLKPQRAETSEESSIGDALTMIPPVTGNGMSMAFESAEIATDHLAAYSRSEINWREAQRRIARACDLLFARRLAWARVLQWLMFSPLPRTGFAPVLLRSHWLWQLLFARTR